MRKIILLTLLFVANLTFAQDEKTVTLTEIGQGKTKDEAKYKALRNALESAFGVFISSKTELLNDVIIKDEIASVTSGSIQKFEIISETQMSDGSYTSIVKATVSVSKFTTFFQNKGVISEFKGGVFAANIKLQELSKTNEENIINNLFQIIETMSERVFDFSIKTKNPIKPSRNNYFEEKENYWVVPIEVNCIPNKNMDYIIMLLKKTIINISLTSAEIQNYQKLNIPLFKVNLNDKFYYFRRDKSARMLLVILIKTIPEKTRKFKISNSISAVSYDEITSCLYQINPYYQESYRVRSNRHKSNIPNCEYFNNPDLQLVKFKLEVDNLTEGSIEKILYYKLPNEDDGCYFKEDTYWLESIFLYKRLPDFFESFKYNLNDLLKSNFTYNLVNYLPINDLSKISEYKIQPLN